MHAWLRSLPSQAASSRAARVAPARRRTQEQARKNGRLRRALAAMPAPPLRLGGPAPAVALGGAALRRAPPCQGARALLALHGHCSGGLTCRSGMHAMRLDRQMIIKKIFEITGVYRSPTQKRTGRNSNAPFKKMGTRVDTCWAAKLPWAQPPSHLPPKGRIFMRLSFQWFATTFASVALQSGGGSLRHGWRGCSCCQRSAEHYPPLLLGGVPNPTTTVHDVRVWEMGCGYEPL